MDSPFRVYRTRIYNRCSRTQFSADFSAQVARLASFCLSFIRKSDFKTDLEGSSSKNRI